MHDRQPEWKATDGYTINKESGTAEKRVDRACTLHFYLAQPGDVLHVSDCRYMYAVCTYLPQPDVKYIYTYDYEPEENWTQYRHDFSEEKFSQEDYVFTERIYFRVVIKRVYCQNGSGMETAEDGVGTSSFSLEKILQWQTVLQPPRTGEYLQRQTALHLPQTGQVDTEEGFNLPAAGLQYDETRRERELTAEIIATVRSVSEKQSQDSLNFILLTDNHYTVNGTWSLTVENLYRTAVALKACGVGLNGFLHLGDATDGMVPAEITRDYVRAMQDDIRCLGIPLYYVIGNHDSNYFRNNPERFTPNEVRELYLPERKKCYYYQDYPEQCLRMFFLESFDPGEEIRYGFHEEELDWLEGLLADTDPDWYVLVFSHVPPTPRLHYWSREIRGSRRLLRILREYQARSGEADDAGTASKDAGRMEGVSVGIAGHTGHLLGYIHGHNHADQIDYEEGFPIISIGCNKCEYFPDKKPEGAVAECRVLGEVSQDLWDVLTMSIKNGTLDFTRFGAGEDRQVFCKEARDGKVSIGRNSQMISMDGNPEVVSAGTDRMVLQVLADKDRERKKPMKKVITYGSFDLFHEGHYNILKRAKTLGDYLIVGVTTEHYDEQRGKLNIVDSLLERIENVRRTGLVDEIIIEDHEGQKIEDVQKYGVDIFVLGSDWKGVYDYLKNYCQVVYLERTPDISSTMLRKEKFPIIRMGVVGSGRIAPRFLSEAKYVSGVNVQCVYNPHRKSAESFGEKYFLESYSGAFETFLGAVDAIYIATPHETHYDYSRRALLAGKHVLCEKPMALTRGQAKELFSIAGQKRLILMEGIKTAFCPGFAQMISIAQSGKIGKIRDVEACFSRITPPHLREMVDVRYGGAFMEFGSYTVLPILKLLGLNYEDIKVRSIRAENGVDIYTKIYFDYAEGMATSKTGLGVKSEGQLLISGTKGYILAESPWWLTRKFQVRYEDPAKIETYTPNFLGDGLRYEIGEFISRINGRSGHAFKLTEEESIAMADVVERFLADRTRQRAEDRRRSRNAGIRIWAHRGASYRYPENTLAAFRAACELPDLAGVELDIQLSKDGEVVVFHDETLDRLMDGSGKVCDYTLMELQQMRFKDWRRELGQLESGKGELLQRLVSIPSMREVLELIKPYALERGIRINIELKNSNIPYEGMEEKILSLAAEYGMEDYVVYSSFNGESVRRLRELDGRVRTGILHSDIAECLRLAPETGADDLHPNVESMLETGRTVMSESGRVTALENTGSEAADELAADGTAVEEMPVRRPGGIVRAWNSREPFYGQEKQYIIYDLEKLKEAGVTDFITNVPEEYLEK